MTAGRAAHGQEKALPTSDRNGPDERVAVRVKINHELAWYLATAQAADTDGC